MVIVIYVSPYSYFSVIIDLFLILDVSTLH